MLYPHVVYLHEAGLTGGRPVVAFPPIAQIAAPPLAGTSWFHNTAPTQCMQLTLAGSGILE